MKKAMAAMAVLTVLSFISSLLPSTAMAQDTERVRRIKGKIREHQDAERRLRAELNQAIGSPPEGGGYKEGVEGERFTRADADYSERGARARRKKLSSSEHPRKQKRGIEDGSTPRQRAKKERVRREARKEKIEQKRTRQKKVQRKKTEERSGVRGKKAPAQRGGGRKTPARRDSGRKAPARRGSKR